MKNNFFVFVFVSFLLSLASCSDSSEENFVNERVLLPFTTDDRQACMQEYSGAMAMLESVSDNNTDNVVFSPLNIMSSLMILANGTNGDSQKEIFDFIAKSYNSDAKTVEEFNELHKKISNNICNLDKTTTLSFNNALWVNESDNGNIIQSFQSALTQNFMADMFPVNDLASKNTMDNINQWFGNNTSGLIKKFLKNPLPKDTKMYLGSSLYYKGQWKIPFDRSNTKKENFTNIDGSQSTVDMMNAEQKLNAAIFNGGKLTILPFGNGAFKLAIILPEEGHTFKECMEVLKTREFLKVSTATNKYLIKIKLPKINIEDETDVCGMLSNLGIKSILDSETADFSNAFKSEKFYLSNIKHVVKFEMNEEGAQAAAVTVGSLKDTANIFESAYDGMEFFADKPFMFMIYETSSLVPVITGIINKL